MAGNYEIDTTDGILTIRFPKNLRPDDIKEAMDEIAGYKAIELRLWDFSSAQEEFSTLQLRNLADAGKSKGFPPAKVALVASKNVHYGLLRMYEVFRADDKSEHRVFRSVEEARAWLKRS